MKKSNIKLAQKKRIKVTEAGWGSELEIHNGNGYCGRILNIERGQKSSLHYHLKKNETFYVLSGRISIDLRFDLHKESMILEEGDSIDIPRFVLHRFKGLQDAKVLEISTEDKGEDDIVRVEEGSTQLKRLWNCEDEEFTQWENKVNRILGK